MAYGDNKRYITGYALLLMLVCGLVLLNICTGSVNISPKEVTEIIFGGCGDDIQRNIIFQIRLPRTVSAFVLGGALALSGYLLQAFFRNPIAGPFILGISSGAKLTVALAMVASLEAGVYISALGMVAAAFAGALAAMGFVLLVSRVMSSMSMLVVAGVMVGYICSAITELVIAFADDSNIINLHSWSLGSFSGASWDDVIMGTAVVCICFLVVIFLAKPLDVYRLGEEYARSMGVDIRLFRRLLVICSSLLAACVTAFAGPVSFVGIAVPHLVKGLMHSSKPILLIPASFLGGGAFCLLCDLLSRTMFSPAELSVSTVTAIFGAPVVVFILIRNNRHA